MVINFKKIGLFILITGIIIIILFLWQLNRDADRASLNKPDNPYQAMDMIEPPMDNKVTGTDNFFAEYRIERERVRSRQIEMLQEVLNNPSLRETQPEAGVQLVRISVDIEKELQTEGMIKAQGFADCVVIIKPGTVLAVLQTADGNLQDQRDEILTEIEKITGYDAEQICMVYRGEQH